MFFFLLLLVDGDHVEVVVRGVAEVWQLGCDLWECGLWARDEEESEEAKPGG